MDRLHLNFAYRHDLHRTSSCTHHIAFGTPPNAPRVHVPYRCCLLYYRKCTRCLWRLGKLSSCKITATCGCVAPGSVRETRHPGTDSCAKSYGSGSRKSRCTLGVAVFDFDAATGTDCDHCMGWKMNAGELLRTDRACLRR